ncbi:MAG: UDP-glucose/GDP-mannose dehydrogenase family protein [Acidimicrobiia bacterium]|nr:UDP-glucose/GDP-mannose dehydrogenase family protein [Acidimicrobiia bacterium]
MDVAVIGGGYVGLVQAAGMAHLGHRVRVGEADPAKLEELEAGRLPIYEKGLAELMDEGRAGGRLTFHGSNVDAASTADVTFLCLPTPPGVDGAADLSVVEAVVRELAHALEAGSIVVIKSTVPVGTTSRLAKRLAGRLRLVGNPEFLREGSAVTDFLRPDRVVIGADDEDAAEVVASLYEGLDARVLRTDLTSAELIKYGANGYLATRLTFVNALANIADSVGADILDVVEGMGLDPRIGPHFLRPGPGYGGSCFPKDTIALLATSRQAGYEFTLLQSVVDADRSQRHWIVGNIRRMLGGDLADKRIGMWGVAFKAGTDDIRESPALKIASMLRSEGAVIAASDPEAHSLDVEMAPDPIAAAKGAELLVVATEWPEFRSVDMTEVAAVMSGTAVYDLRNLLDPARVRNAGLTYQALGRPHA